MHTGRTPIKNAIVRRSVLVLLVLAALVGSPAAWADSAPIPADAAAPGSDPNHGTPLELLAGRIASTSAGRPVAVRCENQNDWNALEVQEGFAPGAELGFVAGQGYYPATNTFAWSATSAELSPAVCLPLQQFAQATAKPTKCQTSTQQQVTVYNTVRYSLTLTVKVRGHLVTRTVWRTKQVPTSVEQTVPGPIGPCFLGAPLPSGSSIPGICVSGSCYSVTANEPDTFWNRYGQFASAILALAHEPIHLWQDQAGAPVPPDALVESQAECSGMQWMAYVAEQLGDTPDDAQALADYFWQVDYPAYATFDQQNPYAEQHPYWSSDCTPGGTLDIRPAGSTVWP